MPVPKKSEGFQGQRSIVLPRQIATELNNSHSMASGLYITDIGYYPKAKYHYRRRINGSEQHILIYCLEGKGHVQVQKKRYDLQPGSFIIIPAGNPHNYASAEHDSWTIYWIHFTGSLSKKIIEILKQKINGYCGRVAFKQKRLDLFNDMYACLERGYGTDNLSYANMCLHHYIFTFLYDDQFNLAEKALADDPVELSISFMQQHIAKPLSLEAIAKSVNFSASHFSALFRKKTGFAPIEYFNHLKIQLACQYLHFTELRVKEIADKLGIEDPYYFSRLFTKLMGMSPNQYRSSKL
ncbi:AraC family transcriptional regulator [Niastella yeongjuensis]|uniref:AraC family transcriptional regulator n=1 Tax=Niastella yeongjuensis TaxID=354355 RepID=A0A1V9DY73_9BACT|nr:AraC family transcriptional regulator [Niastella yeongjuensis]OQP38827.1 AraC family transcriptional regulator [Niastella yeongjuensis]SEO31049.1 AraC-like ligand binding domain-containing protein [Niastella yeongjuensis]